LPKVAAVSECRNKVAVALPFASAWEAGSILKPKKLKKEKQVLHRKNVAVE
jgi:hypothetical protein